MIMFNSTIMWKVSTLLKLDCIFFAKPTRLSFFLSDLGPKYVLVESPAQLFQLNIVLEATTTKYLPIFILFDYPVWIFQVSIDIWWKIFYLEQCVCQSNENVWPLNSLSAITSKTYEAWCCVLFESPLRLFQPNINIWWELSAEMSATSAVYQKPPTASQSFLLLPNPAFHCVSMCKIRFHLHLAGVGLSRSCVYCGATSPVCRKPPLDSLKYF